MPATIGTNGKGGGATTVMVNEGLVVVFKVLVDLGEEGIRKIAILGELVVVAEVDDFKGGGDGGGFGLLSEGDEGVVLGGEVVVRDEGGGGAKDSGGRVRILLGRAG